MEKAVFFNHPNCKCGFVLLFLLVNIVSAAEILVDRSEYIGNFLRDPWGEVGFRFKTGNTTPTVAALGFIDLNNNATDGTDVDPPDGLQSAVTVTLWKESTSSAVAQVTIPSGVAGTLIDGFRYANISGGAVTLQANTNYVISTSSGATLDHYLQCGPVTLNPYFVGTNLSGTWEIRWGATMGVMPTKTVDWGLRLAYGIVNMISSFDETARFAAHYPDPVSGTGNVGILNGFVIDVNLSWDASDDPCDVNNPNPNITSYLLYLKAGSADFNSVTPVNVPAGSPVNARAWHLAAGLSCNQLYFWRVDETINHSAPDGPQTTTGPVWSFTTVDKKNGQVLIDPNTRYQIFDGFGTSSMHKWTSDWYDYYSTQELEDFLDLCYTLDGNGLGAKICRWFMPHGDNPAHDHMAKSDCANASFEPEDGIFDWQGHECILWLAKGAAQRGCTMFTYQLGPPYWLTVSGCTAGSVDGTSNNIADGNEARYAKHICDVLKYFRDDPNFGNIEFDYVTAMGEPEADWWVYGGGQPGCHISADQAVIILRELAAKLKEYNLESKIVAPDVFHTNKTAHLDAILNSDVEPDIAVLTAHQYGNDDKTSMQQWYNKALQYDKKLWQSEWGDWLNDGKLYDKPIEQAQNYAEKIHNALKFMHANAWIIWEPALILDEETNGLFPRKAYWPVAHYSRHIRPGMQMVKSTESLTGCKTTVWIDPNGPGSRRLVIVTYNDSDDYMDVEYDLSDFAGSEILEVRRSFLNSHDENYAQSSFTPISDNAFSLTIHPRAIVTISAEFLGCTTFIPGDLTGPQGEPDCYVDFYDLNRLLQSWLQIDLAVNLSDAGQQPANHIDILDLSVFAANWFECNDKDDPNCTWQN